MDSQERHELKENELADFFKNFGDNWDKWGNTVLLILVVVAGTFAGVRLWNFWGEQQHEAAWTELAAATTPEALVQVADSHDLGAVPELAFLQAGDLYLARAIEGYQPAHAEGGMDDEAENPALDEIEAEEPEIDREQSLAAARRAYEQVLDLSDQVVLRANALMGLAAVAETEGQWDEAEAFYEQAAEEAGELLPSVAAQAQRRQQMLGQISQPVVFAPDDRGPELPFDAFEGDGELDLDDQTQWMDFGTPDNAWQDQPVLPMDEDGQPDGDAGQGFEGLNLGEPSTGEPGMGAEPGDGADEPAFDFDVEPESDEPAPQP